MGQNFKDFNVLNSVEKTVFVLGSENWDNDFELLLVLFKDYIIEIWELRKKKLYRMELSLAILLIS